MKELKKQKEHVNKNGGTYFASNLYGWACAKSPFEAMSKLTLTYEGKNPAISSKKFLEATNSIRLWYIPNEEEFQKIENYGPTKGDGNGTSIGSPAGVLLYGAEENAYWVNKTMQDAMERREDLIKKESFC